VRSERCDACATDPRGINKRIADVDDNAAEVLFLGQTLMLEPLAVSAHRALPASTNPMLQLMSM
jgi:hypothetical protein